MESLKKTPLFAAHEQLGGKIIDFGGWALPVQYTGILEEHKAVRERAGLFDVSHMGEINVQGKDSYPLVQKLITNDVAPMALHQVIYSPMCYPDGGVVDDLLVYKLADDHYLLVVNASNTDKDYDWIVEQSAGMDVTVSNISTEVAQLALQGPKAEEILQKLAAVDLSSIPFFFCRPDTMIAGVPCLVSRTGYTGEDGFEIYLPPENAETVWQAILAAGKDEGILPAGLGARDTLRFEACLPLYGHEISPDVTPLEANLGYFVKLHKESFIGKEALAAQKEKGLTRKQAGLKMIDRGIPRQGYPVKADGRVIGTVSTGSYSPTLNENIALALLSAEYVKAGTEVLVEIRGKDCKAEVVKTPFYKKNYKK